MSHKSIFKKEVEDYLKTSNDTDFVMVGVRVDGRSDPEALVVSNSRVIGLAIAAFAILRNAIAEVQQRTDQTEYERNFVKTATAALEMFGANDERVLEVPDAIGKTSGNA